MLEFVWYNCSSVCGSSAWWFYCGVNGDVLQEGLCHTQDYWTQSPCPCGKPLLTRTSARDTQTLKAGLSQSLWVSSCTQGFVWALQVSLVNIGFVSKHSFAPPTIFLGLLLCPWCSVSFFGGIQHSSIDGCSAMNCNFGVLTGEDEYILLYSAILFIYLFCTSESYSWYTKDCIKSLQVTIWQ